VFADMSPQGLRRSAVSADANTFTPGPTPNTVQSTDGKILTVPDGWALLPPGDAALTRRVKAAGDHWVVAEKKGRKVFSRGIWASAVAIERIRAELEAERSTDGHAKRKEAGASRRKKAQVCPLKRALAGGSTGQAAISEVSS
jgi:hypothetical protein